MPWLQDHLLSVLELLPTKIEPEDDVPNFHRIKHRIALLERQHFVLSLLAWAEDNAHWLTTYGLHLQSARKAVFDGEQTLTFYESLDEDQLQVGPDKQERDGQIDRLVDLLDLHCTPMNQTFIEITVEDLNHVRWDPHRSRQLLAFKVADMVEEPFAWLGRHSAARQAQTLGKSTPDIPPRPARPRL